MVIFLLYYSLCIYQLAFYSKQDFPLFSLFIHLSIIYHLSKIVFNIIMDMLIPIIILMFKLS